MTQYTNNGFPSIRMRRLRQTDFMRRLVSETKLSVDDLIYPIFVCPGNNTTEAVQTMPGIKRLSVDLLAREAEQLAALGIPAVAVFPVTPSATSFNCSRKIRALQCLFDFLYLVINLF